MYEGLDDVDWSAMRHAHGPAHEVPGLLRRLMDPDPEAREAALDAVYQSIHDQGDVHDRTVAAVPFLIEALTTPGIPGRDGIAGLLASICAVEYWPFDDPGEDEEFAATVARTAQARQLVNAAAPSLLDLVTDPDPGLRAELPKLLPVCDGVVEHLLSVAATAPEAFTAAVALTAAARADPALVPLDGAAELLERAYAEASAPVEQAGFTTDTLRGTDRRVPHAARMVDRFTDALGPRVPERAAILARLLRSPDADVAGDALHGVIKLVEGWRGDHAGLLRLLGERLSHPDPRVGGQAAVTMRHWLPLTAVVVEPVAAAVAALDARPRRDGWPAWTVPSRFGPPGLHPTLEILARLGDERALPLLLTALDLAALPRYIGDLLACYPRHVDRIVAAVVPALPAHRAGEPAPLGWSSIHAALRASGPAAAAAVPWLLATPIDEASATTLGGIGAAAVEAVPALRVAAVGDDAALAVAAAGALWHIEGSPDAVPLLTVRLDGPAAAAAVRELGAIGAAAASAAPAVAAFLDVRDGTWWKPLGAALTLWRLTGDADLVAPTLSGAWRGNPATRPRIAAAVTDGALAGVLEPLLRAELASPRRFHASGGWVTEDEQLLAGCRAALSGQAPRTPRSPLP
ncbi:hypothetical protein [Dactylosporangium sp. NPDC000521]|uniref:hypothetical protein n=1 Tax=Dactylosporangium sp. NPDC000521 TaxID=3363975 RepID=UPI003675879A